MYELRNLIKKDKRAVVMDLLNNRCCSDSIGAEIGVFRGEMSATILFGCPVNHLYLIDPYIGGYANFKETPDSKQKYMDRRYKTTSREFARVFPDRCTFIRKTSEDAHEEVPNDLDFIFIDGNHAYDYVLKDLELWVPKVKKGGLVIGDDWSKEFPGVISAVIDYCSSNSPFEDPLALDHGLQHSHQPAPKDMNFVSKACKIWWGVKV